jgi:hypothetical protein
MPRRAADSKHVAEIRQADSQESMKGCWAHCAAAAILKDWFRVGNPANACATMRH